MHNTKQAADASPSVSPVPRVEITPTLAPGKTGPAGTSPRTNYSRVNTGVPATPDAGAMAAKTMAPRGAEMLPKLASEDSTMGIAVRPTVQDMIKAAMSGAADRADISREAGIQAGDLDEEKTASDHTTSTGDISHDYALKLAAAVEYIADEMKKEADQPGEGPGALQVLEAKAEGTMSHDSGHGKNIVPKSTGLQDGNQLENDLKKAPGPSGPQQTSMVNQKHAGEKCTKCDKDPCDCKEEKKEASLAEQIREVSEKTAKDKSEKKDPTKLTGGEKALSALGGVGSYFGATKARANGHSALEGGVRGYAGSALGAGAGAGAGSALGGLVGKAISKKNPVLGEMVGSVGGAAAGSMGGGVAGYKASTHAMGKKKEKKASDLAAELRSHIAKVAEDAINPAHISAGKAVPPDTRQSGESGGVAPAGGQTSMIASNEAVTSTTRRQAKAEPKKDLKAYFTQPALSSSADKTLAAAFTHTSQAGAKIASAGAAKTAAARELLAKIAEAAATKAKSEELPEQENSDHQVAGN